MSQQEKTGVLYDQIVARVIEESRERFQSEGADHQVLGELQKLWWEKLQRSGIVGSQRASGGMGGMGGMGGYQMQPVKREDSGLRYPSGAPPARMVPSHTGADVYGGVTIKNELPQTDGADAAECDEVGTAASRPGRRPRRGDYVEVEVAGGGASLLSVEQLDGAGAGPRKRKHGDDDDEDEDDLGADDDDDDPLNSDDDDDESDSEEALRTDNLVLCQYDKVSRTKNKWKATLKYGVMTLNHPDGRKQDFIFSKATSDMNFAN